MTAVLALAFFAIPLSGVVLGRGGGPITGERAAVAPRPSQGWDAFPNATDYLTQRLPGRGRAVKANTFIAERVLGVTPTYGGGPVGDRALPFGGAPRMTATSAGTLKAPLPPRFAGTDGWTYLQDDLSKACRPPASLEATLARWLGVVAAIRASGRRVVWLIAPEKSTIYPEHLGMRGVDRTCAQRGKASLWSRLEAVQDADVVPLRVPLLAAKRRSRAPVYFPNNSHWNDLGAVRVLEQVLAHASREVRPTPDELRAGTGTYSSDLSPFTGKSQTGSTPTIAIARAGNDAVRLSTVRGPSGESFQVTTHLGGPEHVVRGTTLFVHDSFGEAPRPMMRHYFGRLVDAYWNRQPPSDLVALMGQAQTIVLLTVERSFWTLPSTKYDLKSAGSVVTVPFVEAMRRELGRP
jgi:hypothetical protein